MKLYFTPKSHYARKNRILLDALQLETELIDAGNVADCSIENFADNPLMKVPALIDGDLVLYESDYIAGYVVRKFDADDQFQVLTTDTNQLNARAVMNGVMAAEVELIMAERTGINTSVYSRFDKFRTTVSQGLEWLEHHSDLFDDISYSGFHLVCLWDHLVLYDMFSLNHKKIKMHVSRLSSLDYVAKSRPF